MDSSQAVPLKALLSSSDIITIVRFSHKAAKPVRGGGISALINPK